MFYRCCNAPIATPPIKTNKVLRTSAKLNNNNNNDDSTSKKSSQPAEKRCTRTSSGKIVKKQKLNCEALTTDETVKLGSSDSENEQLPREPWLSPTKPIKPEETKVGVVLRSSGKVPKICKCVCNPKEATTPPKITSMSKIKTPLTAPMTRILRSHQKKCSRRFKNVTSRSSWPAGMVTRSHRRSVKY